MGEVEVIEGGGSPDEEMTLGQRAGRGLGWSLAGNVVFKLGSFAISLVMVRLLAPHDFGLYAVALAANAFLIHVNDMGMIAATVQWRGEVAAMAATARALAIGFSLSWYALFWVAAPVIADLANSPEATPLVRLLTLTIVIDGVTAVSVGLMQRRFQQDKLMKAIAIGFGIGSILSVTLAATGAGAYAFVIGNLVQSVVVAILVLRTAHLPFRLGLDRAVARPLLRFGAPLALGLGIESVLMYSDSFIVGHQLGTDQLGFYLLAFNISSWVPSIIGTAVRYVSIPAFARLAEGEQDELSLGVRRTLPVMVVVVAPIAAAMAALAPAMVGVLYGSHWVPAADALRFLALVMVARMFTSLVFDIQTGRGNTMVTIWLNLAWLIALVPSLWFGAEWGGMGGVAAAHAAVGAGVAIPLAGWMLHRSGVDMVPFVALLRRPILAACASGAVMALLARQLDGHLLELVVAGGAGAVVYLLLAFTPRGWAAAMDWVSSYVGARRAART